MREWQSLAVCSHQLHQRTRSFNNRAAKPSPTSEWRWNASSPLKHLHIECREFSFLLTFELLPMSLSKEVGYKEHFRRHILVHTESSKGCQPTSKSASLAEVSSLWHWRGSSQLSSPHSMRKIRILRRQSLLQLHLLQDVAQASGHAIRSPRTARHVNRGSETPSLLLPFGPSLQRLQMRQLPRRIQ